MTDCTRCPLRLMCMIFPENLQEIRVVRFARRGVHFLEFRTVEHGHHYGPLHHFFYVQLLGQACPRPSVYCDAWFDAPEQVFYDLRDCDGRAGFQERLRNARGL